MPTVTLTLLPGDYAICRLAPNAPDPTWAHDSPVGVIARTPDELSVLCASEIVPAGTQCEAGWRLFKFQGPFAFTQTGILSAVLKPLAEARVGILAISTFDTDYVLVKDTNLSTAQDVLVAAGHVLLTAAASI
jgi:uncharacterized protein